MKPICDWLKKNWLASCVLLGVCTVILFSPQDVQAVQIKKVYRGTASFDNTDIVKSVSIGGTVDTSKSIILLSNSVVSNTRDQNNFFTTQFEDPSTITINRSGVTVYGSVSWQVIEFTDGVSVQRGISSFQSGQLTKTITLPATIDTTKAIPIVYTQNTETGSGRTDEQFLIPTFPTTTSLKLDRLVATSTKAITLTWQVIQFLTDATVQTGTVTFPVPATNATNQAVTATLTALSNGGANALLFFSLNSDTGIAGADAEFYTRGEITNATTLTFVRQYAPGSPPSTTDVTVRYYVVDFSDGTNALGFGQRGAQVGLHTTTLPATVGIAGAPTGASDTTPIVITTTAVHGLSTGQFVNITGVGTNTNANGDWIVTVLSTTTFSLNGSTLTGAGGGGGGSMMPAVQSALGTSVTPERTVALTSASGGGTGINSGTAYSDDLSLASSLTTVGTTNYVETVRDSGARAIPADVNYTTYEFPPLTLTAPNGGEVWRVGATQNITWKHAAQLESGGSLAGGKHAGKIEVSVDGGTSYISTAIATGVDLSLDTYAWTIPASMVDAGTPKDLDVATLRVRITDTDLAARNTDISNANFTIKGTLTITVPNGGETWFVGDTARTITWTKTGNLDDEGKVRLELWTASGTVYDSDITTALTDPLPSALSYAWNPIPDKIGSDRRVKIKLLADPTGVTSMSAADFNIKGTLTLTMPSGGQSWPAQTNQTITWNKTGTFATVKLEYSTNSGGTYSNVIATGVAAGTTSGSYVWTVPTAAISNFVRVKVTNEADTTVFSASATDFAVVPSILVTSPNTGAELWRVGESHNITWNINGSIATVKIEYSTDTGTTWVVPAIATGVTASSGTYAWTIPDAIGDSVRVKISDEAAPATRFDTSDNNFKIRGKITMVAPNGGEVWAVGSSQLISFTKNGSFGNVDVLYSTDGGTTFPTTLTTNLVGTTYTWNPIPDAIGNTVKVRVRATNVLYSGDTFGDSAANFAIKGSFTITSPNGGEQWGASTTQLIIWNKTGTLGAAKLEYSTDGGATYPNTIVASTPSDTDPPTGPNNGQYSWTTPTTTGTQFRVKITLLSDTTVFDTSDANFSLRGSVTLTAPVGGESWVVGSLQNITWTVVGGIANVKLEYSTDGGTTWPASGLIIASTPAAALSYTWTIPDAIGSNVKVRISDAGDATTNSVSASPFTIKGSLTLTAPVGGETWIVGTSQNITWTKTGTIPNVKLEYSTDGGVTYPVGGLIVASTSGVSPYPWTIPDAIGASLRVRISDLNTVPATPSVSGANFTIKGSLTVTAPNGAEQWPIGSAQAITWTKTGSLTGNVKLEYSIDGGVTYPVGNLISSTATVTGANGTCTAPAGGGCYAWTVPDNPTTQARVKITYLNDTTVFTASAANFSIKGSVTITAPVGGEVWVVGQSRNVTWTKGGAIANVKLDYSTDSGATYPNNITLSTPAANLSYAWTVPDSISTTVRVRVADAGDATVNSASGANFTIKGSLTLTAPVGGETWIVNAVNNITWTKTGTIANVKLEYSTNAFLNELQTTVIVASTSGTSLSYAWTVPDAIGTNVKVRITNVADTSVVSVSPAAFTIKGSLTVTSPNGAEVWIVGAAQNITWTKQGSIANVKLEYSKNGFVDELQTFLVIASTPAAALSYAWTVPDAISTTVKVRVSDASDATVKSLSAANFTIKGSLTVTAPNGGEVWTVLSSRSITWTKQGSIVNVSLAYSTDGGSTFPNSITTSTDATVGSYAWTVPDAIGATVKVRATNTADSTVFDDSNANFKIVGALAVTSPVGGEKWTVGSVQSITWTKTGSIANVKLEYSTDSGVTYPAGNLIIATTPATALSYSWTIPNSPSATVRVRISDVTDATVNAVSAADFKIKAGLTVTAPNGGEVWTVNSPQSITWTTVGTAATVKLEYSTDGGNTYPNLIIASTTNTGSFSWTVPDAISTSARVKVTNTADVDSFGASAANFKIRGALTVTAPNGGEQWGISTTQNITWTRTGSIANVKLEYSTDGGTTYPNVITASTAASTGTYAWLVANTPSTTAKVRVSDASDLTVNAQSAANFSIKGSLTLSAPNGGEVWVVGTARNITWTAFGAIANVKLEYSTDGGVTYPVGNLIIASTPAGTGSYSWTIPDAIGSSLRVRVSDASDATVNAQSAANFSIKGSITLTSPVGGEVWIVGAAQNITWTKAGSFLNVKLEYSTNGFFDELQTVLITASTPSGTPASSGSFAWTIPDAIGTSLKVRASDAANATVTSTSAANFTIKGSLTLTSPVGGEIWRVGESRNITWTKTGSIATVKLEYSTDGGTTYSNVITASTSATTGTYTWTVPDAIGTNRRVRITNTADATVVSASAANFEIKGQVTVTAPNGGEVWVVASSHNITWTKQGTFSFVKLEYSTNAFANELQTTVIALSVDATLGTPYAWTVPDAIGTSLRVRATNTADAAVFDVSDANFKIVGSLTLTAPVGGESWTVGSAQSVTWTKVGSIANAKLDYSTDGGVTYPNVIIASTAAGAGAYAWTIPDSIGTNRRVRVSDASDATVLSTSAANFTIMGGFTITAPNGGEVWTVGSAQTISWTTAGTVANVKLEYSTDGGGTYPNLIIATTANTGTYGWTVPDSITTLAKVRISDVNNANALKTSAANFKIRGALTVTAPNGGESWSIGTTQNITWTRTGSIANVKLEYSTDGGTTYPNVITASTPASTGTYAWLIPNAPSATARVRVSDASDATVNAISSTNFSIIGRVTLTAPNGGEVWIVGQNYNITWTLGGSIANVKLQYSTDGGVTWPDPGKVVIASTAASLLSYTWTIPDDISATVKVRASDASNPSVFGTSAANFAIKGSLTVTAPVGGEVWVVGTSQNITWTKTGTIANVKLEYSTDGGTTYPNLINALVNATTGTPYAWAIPDAIGNTVRVKVTNTADSAVFGASPANFSIKGSLSLLSPVGGEVWTVGSAQPITWSKVGSIANVKLEYSTDGGVTYPNVIANPVVASLGSYSWTIPDAITTTARVKVTNLADTTVFASSAANFKIAGSLTLTAPVGGEQWAIGSSKSITWTKTGSIPSVKLEYSTDGGLTYPNLIVASVDATLGTPYAWTVPDNPTATAKVKVTNTADSTVFGVSPANFKIQGSFTLTSPIGGESWVVGSSHNITWTKTGSIANAKLEYSTDGGVTYPNVIVASTPAVNLSYSWVVPDAIGTTLRVRISDASDPTVVNASPANFTIKGSLALTAPNGGEAWVVGTTQSITWTKNGSILNVKLEYSTDAGVTFPNVIVASTAGGNLSYAWVVPDAIGSTLRVRISDVAGLSLGATSAGNFSIKGSLTVTAPVGGEVWTVGSSKNITWTRNGSIANVKLEYSTNGFTDELQTVVITASTPASTGTYAWTVPDAISNTVKVRATDASDASVFAKSPANFTIKGSLTITAPNGGEKWVVGTTQTIAWTRAGSIANVNIKYTTDGTIFTDIIASAPNTGSYAWVIPNTTTTTALVRIINVSDITVTTTSAAYFKIQAGFTITAPNGGENWLVGSSQTITWTTAGTVSFVKLDYSTDGGVTWPVGNVIVSSTANTGTYAWTVPNAVSGTVQVRVSDASDATALDTSNANFRIRAAFTLSAPNGSEQWRVGQVQNILWSAVGTIPSTKLQYSRDGFVADIQAINAAAPSTGTYAWTIPDAISNTVKVRVSDPNDVGALKDSAANFRITGDFTVTAPNGGEQWIVGTTYTITWTKAGSVTNAKIEYSTDGGATYPNVIVGLTPNNGTYAWTIPNSITATARVRISDPNDATANGISAGNFKIKAGFTLTAPVGGEVWTVGTTQNVTWTNTGTVANVKLEYSTNSGSTYPSLIVASTANTGTYAWTVPDAISTGVRVKVSSATDVDAFAASAADFKIRGAFTLTAPNGGEGWGIAQTKTVTWTTTGTIPTVKLSYSTDGGTTYPNVITASVANANSYAWVIPDAPTTTARVRVESTADSTVFAASAANFSLQGNFTLTSPTGGEVWTVNEIRNITWSWGGTIPTVKLTYSTDSGATYSNVIAASAPNGVGSSGAFSYAWTVPNAISTTVRVKVEDPNNSAVFAASTANFKIQGKLVLVAPNGGERWVVNESRTILWTTTGTVPNVKLEYSTDSGTTYLVGNLIVASTPNTGTYTWTMPNNVSTTARVRVLNAADLTVLSQSAADFKIDLYQITFDIRDVLSNNAINQLTVSAATAPAAYTWAASGLASPIVKSLQAGSWSATFTQTSYGDLTLNFVADRDQTIQGFMETKVVHVYDAHTEFAYNTTTDTVTLSSTLLRDGVTVTGATSCTVNIYDGSTLIKTFSKPAAPDTAQGFYTNTWTAPTGLVAGKVYNVVTTVSIATGGVFNSPRTFSITDVKKLQDVQDTVNAKLDTSLSQVKTDIQAKLDTQTTNINTKLDTQTTTIQTKLDQTQAAITTTLTSFEQKADTQIAALQAGATDVKTAAGNVEKRGEDLQATNLKFAGRLMMPRTVLINDKNVKLQYKAIEGIVPLVTITTLDASGKETVVVSAFPMTRSTDRADTYEYTIDKITSPPYTPGKFVTVIVEAETFTYVLQPEKGKIKNTEVGSFIVESTTLSTLEGLVAGQSGTKPMLVDALTALRALQSSASGGGNITGLLETLNRKVDALPSQIAQQISSQGDMAQMRNTLNEVAQQIRALAGDNMGVDLSKMIGKALDESSSITDIRKKADSVQGTTEVMQVLMEQKLGGVDAPVVHVVYQ